MGERCFLELNSNSQSRRISNFQETLIQLCRSQTLKSNTFAAHRYLPYFTVRVGTRLYFLGHLR